MVTIHQPRSEIFLAFDKILLLCNGQVAFFGAPVRVWGFFMRALDNVEEKFMVGEGGGGGLQWVGLQWVGLQGWGCSYHFGVFAYMIR